MPRVFVLLCVLTGALLLRPPATFAQSDSRKFLQRYCGDCHSGADAEAGLDVVGLTEQLDEAAVFASWERIHDRISAGEMPPEDADQPAAQESRAFLKGLSSRLVAAHRQRRGTVLRRLNRNEYQNTLNDMFGTHLDLAGMLPEDGRSHEFDNVGEALGISMVQLQLYMEAAGLVFDTAVADRTTAPVAKAITASYADSREGKQFIGKRWKLLPDGAVVRFNGDGYPTGMLRGTNVREPGRYRVRVTGYAYQSEKPITFRVGGTSFARGSEKPVWGYFVFPPSRSATIQFETWIDRNYMVQIEPYGITDPRRYQRQSVDDYDGPGLAIQNVELHGPIVDEFPSRGHRLVFDGIRRVEVEPANPAMRSKPWYKPQFAVESENEPADAARSLGRVAEAAFRRTLKPEDVQPFVKLFEQSRAAGDSFETALRTAVVAVFTSPRFLFLDEPDGALDQFALASRLAYFLTRTAPDAELMAAAATGALTPEGLRDHTNRLIASPHFSRFITDFSGAWLNLRDMDFTVPDGKLFPEYDNYLRYSMPLETEAFLRELVESNLRVSNIVAPDFAMLNSRLAAHYGLPAIDGPSIRRVALPTGSVRGGFLSQASVLKVSANGTNTSPVTRGVFVLERFLGEPPQPPPPGIPGVEPDIRGAATLRELLAKHRNSDTCRSCHRKIDPPGFALESFNPIGGERTWFRSIGSGPRVEQMVRGRRVSYRQGPPVDCSGTLPDGRRFQDFREFLNFLADDEDALARTLASKLLTFACGRELGFSDRAEVERIVQASREGGHGVRDLIHLVIASDLFQSK